MARYDVGINEGRICPVIAGAPEPRSVDLIEAWAEDEKAAIAVAKQVWRMRYRSEPPSALIGISRPY
jgi:hypothetical protein